MTTSLLLAKRRYVALVRSARDVGRRAGLLGQPSPLGANRLYHWSRSLFAIYDLNELIDLDVPWWTYDAIDQVGAFLKRRERPVVFEYGSGASTVWLAKRTLCVTSVDHDSAWTDRLRPMLASFRNVSLKFVPPDATLDPDSRFGSSKEGFADMSFRAYVEAIRQVPGPFDLIVIDGRARAACLDEAVKHLARDGLIVFDNSRRLRYRQAIAGCGLDRTAYRGLVPSLPFPDETTLLRHCE